MQRVSHTITSGTMGDDSPWVLKGTVSNLHYYMVIIYYVKHDYGLSLPQVKLDIFIKL